MRLNLKKYDKVLLVFFAAALIGTFLIWTFEERFNQEDWESNTEKRYQMADDIIDSDMLIGLSKEDVIGVLGFPYKSNLYGKDNIAYRLGRPPSFSESKRIILVVDFESGRVNKVIRTKE